MRKCVKEQKKKEIGKEASLEKRQRKCLEVESLTHTHNST